MNPLQASNLKHILDELKRIDLIVAESIQHWRKSSKNQTFPGLFISEEEIDQLIAKETEANESNAETRAEQETLAQKIAEEKIACKLQGTELRLEVLAEMFGLDSFEVDALLVALVSEFDSKYEKLFAYLQDDITKKHATVGLIVNLFFKDKEDQIAARQHFSYKAPLIGNLIFHLQEGDLPLLEKTLKLDDRIISFLLGYDEPDAHVASFATLKYPENGFETLAIPDPLKQQLQAFSSSLKTPEPVIQLQGSFELQEFAQAICHQAKKPIIFADLDKTKGENLPALLRLFFREAKLQHAAAYFDKLDSAGEDVKRAVLEELELFDGLTFVASKAPMVLSRHTVTVSVPRAKYLDRLKMWQTLAGDVVGIGDVAVKFKFGRDKAEAAVEAAKSAALLRDPSLAQNDA